MEKKLLTVKETAKILGISPDTIYNKIHKNSRVPFEIKPVRVGRAVRFKKADIDRLVS